MSSAHYNMLFSHMGEDKVRPTINGMISWLVYRFPVRFGNEFIYGQLDDII
jgi:hypothetical protein